MTLAAAARGSLAPWPAVAAGRLQAAGEMGRCKHGAGAGSGAGGSKQGEHGASHENQKDHRYKPSVRIFGSLRVREQPSAQECARG